MSDHKPALYITSAIIIAAGLFYVYLTWQSPIEPEERTAMFTALAENIGERYFDETTGNKVARIFTGKGFTKKYEEISYGEPLERSINRDLHQLSMDSDLSIIYLRKPIFTSYADSFRYSRKMDKKDISQKYGFNSVKVLPGNIGYIMLNSFVNINHNSLTALRNALYKISECESIIIDLRENSGGSPDMVYLLCSHFFDNDSILLTTVVDRINGRKDIYVKKEVDGPRFPKRSLYILTSKNTYAAGEEFAYILQQLGRATLVGESTIGAAFAGNIIPLTPHFAAFIPQSYTINPVSGKDWRGNGVNPDIHIDAKQAYEEVMDRIGDI
ncbi:MAG: S41 family peptidase [Bacteroidetes bacterium]|nr:S41 family peptidase [Bacteroidota bacterium]